MSNICYLSFPDSNSGCMGDTQFHFRTKCCTKLAKIRTKYDDYFKDYNSKCLSLLQVNILPKKKIVSNNLINLGFFNQFDSIQ